MLATWSIDLSRLAPSILTTLTQPWSVNPDNFPSTRSMLSIGIISDRHIYSSLTLFSFGSIMNLDAAPTFWSHLDHWLNSLYSIRSIGLFVSEFPHRTFHRLMNLPQACSFWCQYSDWISIVRRANSHLFDLLVRLLLSNFSPTNELPMNLIILIPIPQPIQSWLSVEIIIDR